MSEKRGCANEVLTKAGSGFGLWAQFANPAGSHTPELDLALSLTAHCGEWSMRSL
jgi:hypothetical protein